MAGVSEYRKAVRRSSLSQPLRHVLHVVAEYADYKTGRNACPSTATVARECGLSARQVQRLLVVARALGWLSTADDGLDRRPRRYSLTVPAYDTRDASAYDTGVTSGSAAYDIRDASLMTSATRTYDTGVTQPLEAPLTTTFLTAPASPTAPTAQSLLGEYIDACRTRPPDPVVKQLGRHSKALLAEGIGPDHIRAGLNIVRERGLHPSTLPSAVNEVLNPPTRARGQSNGIDLDAFLARNNTHPDGHRIIEGEIRP